MKVRALRDCYVGEIYRNAGDEFDVPDTILDRHGKEVPFPLGDKDNAVMMKAEDPVAVAAATKELPLFAPGVPQPKAGYGQSMTQSVPPPQNVLAPPGAQGGASGKLGSKKVI